MRTIRYICTFAILCAIFLVLSGCGGGGSDEEFCGPPEPEVKLYKQCTVSPQTCNS